MKLKRNYIIVGILILIVAILSIRFLAGSEDNWIKNKNGIWVKHGNPSTTPDYVSEQHEAMICANELYTNAYLIFSVPLNSQCLGNCGDYAVDLVNVPRQKEDDVINNQCSAFLNGEVSHFIELDKEGNIVRII